MPSDFDVEQYLKELFKDYSPPKEKLEVVRETLAQKEVAQRLKEMAMMRSDYSRSMDQGRDEVRRREEELQRKIQETEQFYQAQILADHNNAEAFQKLQQEVQRYRQGQGFDPNTGGETNPNQHLYMTKDEFQKSQSQLQQDALKLMGKTNYLSMKHFKEFGEVLDVDAWYQHAMQKGLPLDVAYDSYTAGLRQKKLEEQHQKDLEKAKEEGRMEALSKVGLPLVDSHSPGIHAMKTAPDIPRDPAARIRAATEAYLRREGQ